MRVKVETWKSIVSPKTVECARNTCTMFVHKNWVTLKKITMS